MTQILVLTSEDTEPTAVGITHSDIAPEQAQAMCQAASRHFAELSIEAEVQRRIAAIGGKQVEEPEFGETVLDS